MLENPKILDAYVKILNKKHPNFFHETIDINSTNIQRVVDDEDDDIDESDLEDEKLKENDNLKSKKRQKLQEEFKKSEFKHIYNQLELAIKANTTTTTTATFKNFKLNESNLIKKSNLDIVTKPTTSTATSTSTKRKPISTYSTRFFNRTSFQNRVTELTATGSKYLTINKPTTLKVPATKESSKQILERFFKSKNKGNDT